MKRGIEPDGVTASNYISGYLVPAEDRFYLLSRTRDMTEPLDARLEQQAVTSTRELVKKGKC